MNPLNSILGTIITGFVLSIIIVFILGTTGFNILEIEVWLHVLAGVVWIGLLYYFNFVQVPGMAKAKADGTAAGIATHIAPRALLWFRWGAVVTWLTGVGALQNLAENEIGRAHV